MKKSLLALAALGAFAGVAHAQSSVTLYGIVDEGFNINTNAGGKHLYNLSSGVLQGSRWGLRGTEDLGGGLKAIFVLENGFDVNTGKLGQGGLEFGRQAYVGLSSNYGSITLGRQYDSAVDYVGPLEVGDQWGGYIAAHPGDLDNLNNDYRVNNSIKFTSNNYNGLTFGGLYSLGGVAGETGRNQIFSLGAGYANGPLVLGAAYLNVRNPNVSFFGNSTSGTVSTTTSNVASPVFSGYGSANTYQVIAAGGAYTFGAATIGGTYSNIKFMNLGASYASPFAGQTATFNNAEINFKYQLTPALLIGTAYDYTRGSKIEGDSAAQYHQVSAGVDYFLSKRTDVYIIGVYQHALGETLNAAGTAPTAAVAAISNLTPSANQNQLTARVGIRAKF
ncbi:MULTISPECIES: porin [Paraburkholderia]|jgi:predicted porin|uniref:Outer membrane protein (Porin) n=1 Tax=Paraburkholderia phenazinium TaxID=60549 RepID=A0A1N6LIR2_9BURK|nr:porin [Paraburkholderia phenazinium]SIO68722.1 Outer membrane protein (porin) [Paraburkholderia phenazinium]